MFPDPRLAKVSILLQQEKYAEAAQILKDLLSQDPYNVTYLALLAEVNLRQEKYDIAESIIDTAIGQAPDESHLFYVKSKISIQRNKYDDAEAQLQQAIELDPFNANYFATMGSFKLWRKKYSEALELANKALELDAENLLGLNIRSTALLKLNRKEESFQTIEGALREDPTNAYTHTNYGWGLLEKGDHKKALQHFKEALKQEPTHSYAQSGMMEALKASNPIYRLFLKYSFWIGNLTAKYQWGVIIGIYVGYRAIGAVARANPELSPFLTPLLILLSIIAFSTWIITPVSNLFLRFNKYGKFLLSRKEKISSNFVAGGVAVALVGLALYLLQSDERYLTLVIFGVVMMIPFSVMLNPSQPKHLLKVYAAGMAFVGIAGISMAFLTGELINNWMTIFVVGFIAFQWIANFVMIKASNR